MRNLVYLLICLFFVFGCSSKEQPNEDGQIAESQYFVKYVSNGLEGTYSVTYVDEDGRSVELSNIKGADFERTVGPVTKGFNAKYSVKGTLNYTTIAVRIEIKKDNEPFVVKKENLATSHGYPCFCSVSYTIE